MLKYNVHISQILTQDGIEWIAKYPSVQGSIGGGSTQEEALKVLEENTIALLQLMTEDGQDIPKFDEPEQEKNYSGNLLIRTTKTNHRNLQLLADKEEVSINQILNNAVAYYLGSMDTKKYMKEQITDMFSIYTLFIESFQKQYSSIRLVEPTKQKIDTKQLLTGFMSNKGTC